MKIPPYVEGLSHAVDRFIRAAVNHDDYVAHASPESSTRAALASAEHARSALEVAVETYVRAEGHIHQRLALEAAVEVYQVKL